MEHLTKASFAKISVQLRRDFIKDDKLIKRLNNILNNLILTKSEVREIISSNSSSNANFVNRLLRSINKNIEDDEATLSRKLEKHCKRESTENPKKQKEIKLKHILKLLNDDYLITEIKKDKRIILVLDNVPTHRSKFIFEIAKILNIYLLFLSPYSPDLNPIESAWDYSKFELKRMIIDTKDELIDKSIKLFNEITSGDSLYKTTIERFFPMLL